MSVTYPLFVFEKDDNSMRLVENENRILYHMEAIDIENDEYVFWDADGAGVSIVVTPTTTFETGKLERVTSSPPVFPLHDAFKLYAESLGISDVVAEGAPLDVWRRIQTELAGRPRKRGLIKRLFSGKE